MNRKAIFPAFLIIFGCISAFFWTRKSQESSPGVSQQDPKTTHQRFDLPDLPQQREKIKDPNERVRVALERFKEEQAKIPEGAAVEQLAAIKEKTAQLVEIETPLPSITLEVDENGTKWKKLVYPSGELRYELAQ